MSRAAGSSSGPPRSLPGVAGLALQPPPAEGTRLPSWPDLAQVDKVMIQGSPTKRFWSRRPMRCAKAILGLATLSLSSTLGHGQVTAPPAPRFLVRDGDAVIGLGAVDRLGLVQVVDSGMWLVSVDTISGTVRNTCMLRSGFLTLRKGMALPVPVGSIATGWGSTDLAANGDLAMLLLVQEAGETNSVEYLFWNMTPLVGEGDVMTGAGFGPGTTLDSVRVARVTADRTVIALVKVVNPAISTTAKVDALMRYRMDAQGNVVSSEVLATKRTQNDVLGTPIEEIGSPTAPEQSLNINQRGDFVIPVNGLGRKVLMKNLD